MRVRILGRIAMKARSLSLWRAYYAHKIGRLITRLDIMDDSLCVDFGCGTMRFRKYVRGRYIGVDAARHAGIDEDCFIQCDLNTSFPDIRFDRGIMILVMELLKDPGRFIEELSRHIAPDGRILATIPNFKSGHYRYWKRRDIAKDHPTSALHNGITLEYLVEKLETARFRILETGGMFAYPYSRGDDWPLLLQAIPVMNNIVAEKTRETDTMSYHYVIAAHQE